MIDLVFFWIINNWECRQEANLMTCTRGPEVEIIDLEYSVCFQRNWIYKGDSDRVIVECEEGCH